MGQGPDVTSNREHDDSETRTFTCFCGKGWKSRWKKMLARCAVVWCSNTTNLQEVLRFMPYRFMERWSFWREETYRVMARCRDSEMCEVSSVICSIKHFKPDDLARCLDFQREEGILLTQWLKREEFENNRFSIDSCSRCCIWSEKQQHSQSAQPTDSFVFARY